MQEIADILRYSSLTLNKKAFHALPSLERKTSTALTQDYHLERQQKRLLPYSLTPRQMHCQRCSSSSLIRELPFADFDSEDKVQDELVDSVIETRCCPEGDFEDIGAPCVSTHDDEEEWLICKDCHAYHVRCPQCRENDPKRIQLCRFIGFAGFFSDDSERARIPPFEVLVGKYKSIYDGDDDGDLIATDMYTNRITTQLTGRAARYLEDCNTNGKYLHHDFVEYYVGDFDQYYAENTNMLLTGPDGGMSHSWKCPQCLKKYSFTDK